MWNEKIMDEMLEILGWKGGTHTQVKESIKVAKVNMKRNNRALSSITFFIGDKVCIINRFGVGSCVIGKDVIKGYHKVRILSNRMVDFLVDHFEALFDCQFKFAN